MERLRSTFSAARLRELSFPGNQREACDCERRQTKRRRLGSCVRNIQSLNLEGVIGSAGIKRSSDQKIQYVRAGNGIRYRAVSAADVSGATGLSSANHTGDVLLGAETGKK